jgi:hypothetical protein
MVGHVEQIRITLQDQLSTVGKQIVDLDARRAAVLTG